MRELATAPDNAIAPAVETGIKDRLDALYPAISRKALANSNVSLDQTVTPRSDGWVRRRIALHQATSVEVQYGPRIAPASEQPEIQEHSITALPAKALICKQKASLIKLGSHDHRRLRKRLGTSRCFEYDPQLFGTDAH